MADFRNILEAFPPEREQALRAIERFSMFDVFFYRPTLWHHQIRVHLLVRDLSPLTERTLARCDTEKAQVLALVHDDAEIITGDVQLGHKQHMTAEELRALDEEEDTAIEQLATEYPREVGGYDYRQLFLHALHKDCLEARLVSYADKLDAYLESLHEVWGGNVSAVRSLVNYMGILKTFGQTFPDLQPLLACNDSPLTDIERRTDPYRAHKENYAHLNAPHTPESVRKETEMVVYNRWRELVLENLGDEGVEILTHQKEFL